MRDVFHARTGRARRSVSALLAGTVFSLAFLGGSGAPGWAQTPETTPLPETASETAFETADTGETAERGGAADTLATQVAPEPVSIAAVGPTLTLEGHGWGHGRGLGQYGSLGYALAGWSSQQIVDWFYGGTTTGAVDPASEITVRLTDFDGVETLLYQNAGTVAVAAAPGVASTAWRARHLGANAFEVSTSPTCAGPWTVVAANVAGPVVFDTPEEGDDPDAMIQACEPGGTQRWYRGDFLAVADTNLNVGRTVNRLKLDSYLRGVVPRESPASWGSQGGGAGMNALRAQAIAARSYAWAENRYTYSGMLIKTCDTASCQVYMGFGSAPSAGAPMTRLEDARSDQAILDTVGVVRLMGSGSVARTEFSSSTGGHTVQGTFTAVVDDGDAIASNPNHKWKTQIATSAIESAWPTIGTFTSLSVTVRNGLGNFGGRAQTVVISGTGGKVTVTGNEVRSRLGLKSDWFRVFQAPSGGIGGYWLADTKGAVYTFGNAGAYGSASTLALNKPMVGMERTVSGAGYWMVASDGGIFSYGDARFFGSTGNIRLNKPIVGMERTPSGKGYWMVASDGGIFSYGDAQFFGSTGAMVLNQPIVGMAATPSGSGYWLVASDGGVFSFGDAQFFGSTGSITLAKPIVGMASSPDAAGYWMIASDGGLFAFGNATYRGSLPGIGVSATAVGMEPTLSGGGYLIATTTGAVHSFGDAPVMGGIPDVDPAFTGTVRDLVAAAG